MFNTTGAMLATRAGDQDAFQRLTDPYHRELLVHCYRILGSFEDAEISKSVCNEKSS